MNMTNIEEYPKYYNVDDIPVVLELVKEGDKEIVKGKCGNGQPYAIGKAMVDGNPITKDEYEQLSVELYGAYAQI
jgi:malate/lactate dehydrogenase